MRHSLLLSFLTLFAYPLAAEQWIIPAATNATASNRLHYATDLTILNRGDSVANVAIELIGFVGATAPTPIALTLAPGQTYSAANALKTLWNLTEQSGALRITGDQSLLIQARTYLDTPPGAGFGFGADAIPSEQALEAGGIGHSLWVTQNAATTSIAGAVLLAASNSMDEVVFDPAGNELGRVTVSGGPMVVETPVSGIVAADVPVGRMELQVTSGRVIGYLTATDNTTGDAVLSESSPEPGGLTSVVLNALTRGPGPGGTVERAAVRMFNASADPATVTFTALSANAPLALPSRTLTLASGQTQEFTDVLGSLFGAADGTTATLRVSSPSALLVEGRNVAAPADGSAGSFGALQPAAVLQRAGADAALAGLRSADTVGFFAGADGTTATLILKDQNAAVLAETDSAVTLAPFTGMESTLPALFSGLTLPDGPVTLDVIPSAGAVDVYRRSSDPSGDWLVSEAAALQPYSCPRPQILNFLADPQILPAGGGPVELDWTTAGADTVTLSPVLPGVTNLNGTFTATVTSGVTYTLQASGACGTTTQSVTVAVGPPALLSVTPASAAPGQIVTLHLANVGDPSQVNGVIFKMADGQGESSMAGITDSGDIQVMVPLMYRWINQSYWSGPLQILVDAQSGQSAGVPFTITAPAPAGDSVAGWRSLVDDIDQWLQSRYADLQSVPNGPASVRILQPIAAREIANLRKALDDIAAKGTATMPVDAPSVMFPSPATVTLTRQDLDRTLALFQNASQAAAPAQTEAASASEASRTRHAADGSAWALLTNIKDLQYPICLAAEYEEIRRTVNRGFLDTFWDSLGATVDGFGDIVEDLGKLVPGVVFLNKFRKVVSSPSFYCHCYPISLKYFRADPTPDSILALQPVLRFKDQSDDDPPVTNNGTIFWAGFAPIWTKEQAADMLVQSAENKLEKEVLNSALKAADKIQALTNIHKQVAQMQQAAVEAVTQVLQFFNIDPKPVEKVVYKADLADVGVGQNSTRILDRDSYDMGKEEEDSAPAYGYHGKVPGGLAQAEINIMPHHFLDLDTGNTIRDLANKPLQPYDVPVEVGYKQRAVQITWSGYNWAIPPFLQGQKRITMGQKNSVNIHYPFLSSTDRDYRLKELGGIRTGTLDINATQIDSSTWRFKVSTTSHDERTTDGGIVGGGITISIVIPRSRSSSGIHVQGMITKSNQTSGDMRTWGIINPALSCLTDRPGGMNNLQLQIPATSGQQSVTFDSPNATFAECSVGVTGNGGEGSGTATMTIKLLGN